MFKGRTQGVGNNMFQTGHMECGMDASHSRGKTEMDKSRAYEFKDGEGTNETGRQLTGVSRGCLSPTTRHVVRPGWWA